MKYRYIEKFLPAMNDGAHVFVFGSNWEGVHGKGAAKEAEKFWGAKRGTAYGFCGMSYAIPTKNDWRDKSGLLLDKINIYVDDFMVFAAYSPNRTFLVTPIGTGFAGYSHAQIAPMFRGAPTNCVFVPAWKEFLESI